MGGPPVITTTTKTATNNGNDNNIDAEVIIVPPTVTIFDNANWNDIEISVGPTNLTQKKIQILIKQNSNQSKELILVR